MMSEMENTLWNINSRLYPAKEKIIELKQQLKLSKIKHKK